MAWYDRIGLCVSAVCVALFVATAQAQIEEDWAVFSDDQSDAQCDIVTGSNQDFVVLFDSGNLATVSGVTLVELFVDLNNAALPVTFNGVPFGFLDFRADADDQPTLFWLTLTDTVVGIDAFDAEPFDSGLLPSQIGGTKCDACLIIESSFCDGDGGGSGDTDIPDEIIDICGAGLLDALALAALSFPVLGFCAARRRR